MKDLVAYQADSLLGQAYCYRATTGPGQKGRFSSWGGVTWFAPGQKLIASGNIDHANNNAWVSLRHGTPMYNVEYSGTSASNPTGTGFLACLMSGTKPGPRMTMLMLIGLLIDVLIIKI